MVPGVVSESIERGGRRRIIFTQEENSVVYGPFVETRPVEESVSEFLTAYGLALTTALSQIIPFDPEQALRDQVLVDVEMSKRALGIDDARINAIEAMSRGHGRGK